MYRRGWPAFILMLGLCSLGLAAGFSFAQGTLQWFWTATPWVAAVLLAVSLSCGGALLLWRRHRA